MPIRKCAVFRAVPALTLGRQKPIEPGGLAVHKDLAGNHRPRRPQCDVEPRRGPDFAEPQPPGTRPQLPRGSSCSRLVLSHHLRTPVAIRTTIGAMATSVHMRRPWARKPKGISRISTEGRVF